MGDAVIEEAMMATSLMDEELMDGSYDPYGDMASFSANLCDVVQEDDMAMYSPSEEPETYVNRTKRLQCKQCGKSFKNKLLLKKHTAMHSKDNPFECDQCFKKFNRKESLTRHMLVHSGMKFFECPECGRMFNQNGHLRTHMLVHTKEKNFECDICFMKFARKDNLKRHSQMHDKKKKFECNVCQKRFIQNCHLESHMLTHTQEKNFECQQCLMKFARKDTLKRHMLVHSKDKTYECESCNAKFFQNSHLKAHVLVHTKEKTHHCPDCDKKFARKGSLKRHMLVHTGERNFECPDCGKTFIQKTHLNKHVTTHTGRKPGDEDGKAVCKVEVESPVKSEDSNTGTGEPYNPNKPVNLQLQPPKANTSVKDLSQSSKKSTNPSKGPENNDSSAKMTSAPATTNGQQQQQQMDNAQHYPVQQSQRGPAGSTARKQQDASEGAQAADGSQLQPSNIIANSNSVMALALLDHFLTGNESQDNIPEHQQQQLQQLRLQQQQQLEQQQQQQQPPPPQQQQSSKGKSSAQWSQKTHQELLAAQTLSAIGQRNQAGNENYAQAYVQGGFVNPQVTTACSMQPIPQGFLVSGSAAMKIRPPTNAEWLAQEKGFVHPQNVVYNVPPPPAHELFRYCSPTNMPLPHTSNPRDMVQIKDGIPRLPDGTALPADMRASPRKPKYPQKVVVPLGDWQYLPVTSSSVNPNMPVYAHSKHPSEVPRLLDKQ